ncbi:MAG: DeoR/GlpR family DNA-binding transcription regulator [Nitriliruptoraceae bacterium]
MTEEVRLPARVRRDRMLAVVREREFVPVAELAERFDISEVTVRGDLDALAERGQLRRVRGGAVPAAGVMIEHPFEDAKVTAAREKRDIGRAAARLVSSGDTVILDVGTTTTAIARELAAREDLTDVTAFTSSLTIAMTLEAASPRITVVVTGGTLRPTQHSLVEPLAGLVLAQIHAGLCFLGCNGVDADAGVTNVNLPETQVKQLMLRAAGRRIVCADHRKLGAIALAHVCDLDQVDLLVTDGAADPGLLEGLRDTGLEVQLA